MEDGRPKGPARAWRRAVPGLLVRCRSEDLRLCSGAECYIQRWLVAIQSCVDWSFSHHAPWREQGPGASKGAFSEE